MTLFSTFDRMAWSECFASYIFNFDDFDFMDVMCLILLFTQVVLFALFSPGLPLLPYYIQVTDYNIIRNSGRFCLLVLCRGVMCYQDLIVCKQTLHIIFVHT